MKKIISFLKEKIKQYKLILILFILLSIGFFYSFINKKNGNIITQNKATAEEPVTIFINPQLYGKEKEEKREYLLNNFPMDNIIGNINAKITVIEYSSFTCKYCKSFRKEVNKLVKDYAIDKNIIRYVFRPLYNTRTIPLGAFIQCAKKEDKENIVDYFFTKDIEKVENMEQFLIEAGKKFNMNEEYVKKCIYDKDMYQKLIYLQQETNDAFDIKATPLLFINGEEYYGYKTSVKLKTIIDSKL